MPIITVCWAGTAIGAVDYVYRASTQFYMLKNPPLKVSQTSVVVLTAFFKYVFKVPVGNKYVKFLS